MFTLHGRKSGDTRIMPAWARRTGPLLGLLSSCLAFAGASDLNEQYRAALSVEPLNANIYNDLANVYAR